jgi:hypothetical protein
LKTLSVDHLGFDCLGFKLLDTSIVVTGVQEREVVEHLVATAKSGEPVALQVGEDTGDFIVRRTCCTAFVFYPVDA